MKCRPGQLSPSRVVPIIADSGAKAPCPNPDHHKRKELNNPRITVVNPAAATGEAKRLLDAVQARLGVTPNFVRALAHAPAALEGFLGLYTIAGKGVLDHRKPKSWK
jgi:hypothetical protein